MARVSAERMFKSHFPKAYAVKSGLRFWVFIGPNASNTSGNGFTKPQAWADACDRHGIKAIKEQP